MQRCKGAELYTAFFLPASCLRRCFVARQGRKHIRPAAAGGLAPTKLLARLTACCPRRSFVQTPCLSVRTRFPGLLRHRNRSRRSPKGANYNDHPKAAQAPSEDCLAVGAVHALWPGGTTLPSRLGIAAWHRGRLPCILAAKRSARLLCRQGDRLQGKTSLDSTGTDSQGAQPTVAYRVRGMAPDKRHLAVARLDRPGRTRMRTFRLAAP